MITLANATPEDIAHLCRKVYIETQGKADLDLCDVCAGPCYKGSIFLIFSTTHPEIRLAY